MFGYRFPNGKIYKEESLYPITDAMESFDDLRPRYLDMEKAKVVRRMDRQVSKQQYLAIPRFSEEELFTFLREYVDSLDWPGDEPLQQELQLALKCGKNYSEMIEIMKELDEEHFAFNGWQIWKGDLVWNQYLKAWFDEIGVVCEMLEPTDDCSCCKAMWHAQQQKRPMSAEELEEGFREARESGRGVSIDIDQFNSGV